MTESASHYHSACQELENRLATSLAEGSSLKHQHEDLHEIHSKQTSSLEQQLQAAQATINQFKKELQDALANLAAAEASNLALRKSVAACEQQLQARHEQLDASNQSLLTQTADYESLSNKHAQLVATCSELSASVQKHQLTVQTKGDEAIQLLARLTAEKAAKVYLSVLSGSS